MPTNLTNVIQNFLVVVVLGLGVFATIRGVRAWQNPENSWGLGLGWYTAMARWLLPPKDKDRVNKIMSSPAVVRAFAVTTFVLGVFGVVGMIAILILG